MAGAFGRQEAGDHYLRMGIQPWEVIDRGSLDYYRGTAVAYIMRAGMKGAPPSEDIRKAIHTLEHYLELLVEPGGPYIDRGRVG